MIVDVIAVLLILLIPFNWFAAGVLIYVSKLHPQILSLRERAITAFVCAIIATLAGVLGWARLGVLDLSGSTALVLIAIGLILVSIPNLYWLFLLARGRWNIG